MRKSVSSITKNTLTLADIASLCGWSTATLNRKIRKPELAFPRPLFPPHISKLKLFDRREVEAWLRRHGDAP